MGKKALTVRALLLNGGLWEGVSFARKGDFPLSGLPNGLQTSIVCRLGHAKIFHDPSERGKIHRSSWIYSILSWIHSILSWVLSICDDFTRFWDEFSRFRVEFTRFVMNSLDFVMNFTLGELDCWRLQVPLKLTLTQKSKESSLKVPLLKLRERFLSCKGRFLFEFSLWGKLTVREKWVQTLLHDLFVRRNHSEGDCNSKQRIWNLEGMESLQKERNVSLWRDFAC